MENLKDLEDKVAFIASLGKDAGKSKSDLLFESASNLARRPGFYDFVEEQGGCDMVIVRDGKIVASFAAAFRVRSDPPGLVIPDFRNEKTYQITEAFLKQEASILAAGVSFIMDESIDNVDALFGWFEDNGILPPKE